MTIDFLVFPSLFTNEKENPAIASPKHYLDLVSTKKFEPPLAKTAA